jgi:hypothetical protein
MLLRIVRFVNLICAALACGLTLTHTLEMPGKQQLGGAEWLVVQHTSLLKKSSYLINFQQAASILRNYPRMVISMASGDIPKVFASPCFASAMVRRNSLLFSGGENVSCLAFALSAMGGIG